MQTHLELEVLHCMASKAETVAKLSGEQKVWDIVGKVALATAAVGALGLIGTYGFIEGVTLTNHDKELSWVFGTVFGLGTVATAGAAMMEQAKVHDIKNA